jgi:hypothetical protein
MHFSITPLVMKVITFRDFTSHPAEHQVSLAQKHCTRVYSVTSQNTDAYITNNLYLFNQLLFTTLEAALQ